MMTSASGGALKKARLGRPKTFDNMPELRYGRLAITDWVVLEGVFPEGIIIQALVDEDIKLRLPPALEVHREHFIELNNTHIARKAKRTYYNGPFVPMTSFFSQRSADKHERPIFHIHAAVSGYFDYVSVIADLDSPLHGGTGTVRDNFFKDWSGEVSSELPVMGCPGLTLAVITRDQFVILVRRSRSVSVAPGAWHCSVDEGVRPEDVVDGAVDYERVALRGMETELGIKKEQVVGRPVITSMGYSRRLCQYGAIGHAFLNIHLHTLMDALPLAKQGRENEAWKAIPFTPKSLSKEFKRMVKSGDPAIPSFGLATLIMALHASKHVKDIRTINARFEDEVFASGALVYPSNVNPPNVKAFG